MPLPAGGDASKPPPHDVNSVSAPSDPSSRLDQLMTSSSTSIGFMPSKPAQRPLAVRQGAAYANGANAPLEKQLPDPSSKASDAAICSATASLKAPVT